MRVIEPGSGGQQQKRRSGRDRRGTADRRWAWDPEERRQFIERYAPPQLLRYLKPLWREGSKKEQETDDTVSA